MGVPVAVGVSRPSAAPYRDAPSFFDASRISVSHGNGQEESLASSFAAAMARPAGIDSSMGGTGDGVGRQRYEGDGLKNLKSVLFSNSSNVIDTPVSAGIANNNEDDAMIAAVKSSLALDFEDELKELQLQHANARKLLTHLISQSGIDTEETSKRQEINNNDKDARDHEKNNGEDRDYVMESRARVEEPSSIVSKAQKVSSLSSGFSRPFASFASPPRGVEPSISGVALLSTSPVSNATTNDFRPLESEMDDSPHKQSWN